MDLDVNLVPPGCKVAMAGGKGDDNLASRAGFAADRLPEIMAVLKGHGMSVIEVNRAFAIASRVDVQIKRSRRGFRCAFNQRLPRKDGAFADENRQLFKAWCFRDVAGAVAANCPCSCASDAFARPVIKPPASRQTDFIAF